MARALPPLQTLFTARVSALISDLAVRIGYANVSPHAPYYPSSTVQRQNAADFCDDPYPFRAGKSVRPTASIDKPVPMSGEMREINILVLA